ncbi:MAG: hypothetical protein ACJ74Z_22445 [Bryobacteraceae bacterium]
MPIQVSQNHPLRRLFSELLYKHLIQTAQLDDRQISDYVGDLLVNFTHVDNLYRLRNSKGRRLEDVGEMLIASNPLLEGRSFEYEREVRKHIGDYTLFLTGLFPKFVAGLNRKPFRVDSLIDYLKAGKESYQVVAAFDQFEYREIAPLFRKLAEKFELCVYALNLMKDDLARQQVASYNRMKQILM